MSNEFGASGEDIAFESGNRIYEAVIWPDGNFYIGSNIDKKITDQSQRNGAKVIKVKITAINHDEIQYTGVTD